MHFRDKNVKFFATPMTFTSQISQFHLRDKFSRFHVDDTVTDLCFDNQVRGLVPAWRFGLIYPLRGRTVHSEVATMTTDNNDVLPIDAEQWRDQ